MPRHASEFIGVGESYTVVGARRRIYIIMAIAMPFVLKSVSMLGLAALHAAPAQLHSICGILLTAWMLFIPWQACFRPNFVGNVPGILCTQTVCIILALIMLILRL